MVGTGFTAKLRAPTLQADPRSQLVAVTGHTPEKTQEFSQIYQATAVNSWQELVDRDDVDLVMICTINRDHGPVARAALEAGKHVVVEYPLSLDPVEAETLLALADRQGRLLHIEHIELLGGVHNALKASLAEAGEVFYARYATISSKRPAPRSWTYHPDLFGFPFTGALSRLHRLTDLWGTVATVSGQSQFWPSPQPEYFTACLCTAQLQFTSGAIAELIYGKGERFWKNERKLEVYGDRGTLILGSSNQKDYVHGFTIQGAPAGEDLRDLEIPVRLQFPQTYSDGRLAPFIRVVDNWVEGIHRGQTVVPSLKEGVYSQLLMDLTLESHATGTWVTVPNFEQFLANS